MTNQKTWWKEAVVYQIYPKSFVDSNGDGIGDLQGIITRLDYLKLLGVDVLWLNPIYSSPDIDNGYEISDYQAVHPQYGTMADLECLLDEAHQRGMKVIMDLVINHTSDEHPWFVESRKSTDNPDRDFYIWRDGKGGQEPNNWGAHFTKSAWTLDAQTNQYYLHIFSPHQPDLNWDNPKVREALYHMIQWWLEKGIDGFRLDAISFISKSPGLPDNPGKGPYIFSLQNMMNGPAFHDYLRELNRKALCNYDIVTVGECIDFTVQDAIDVSAPKREELNMPFLFEHIDYYSTFGKNPQKLKEILTRWQVGLHDQGWVGITFNSHDLPRVVSFFGNDTEYREASAKLFATLLLTLEGTPVLYQGEEIGMTNTYYDSIGEYNDVASVNFYQEKVAEGTDPNVVLGQVGSSSRDRGRSPYHWNSKANGGFTSGKPWLGINSNYEEINLESNLKDANSVFHFYQRMIAIRKLTPPLIYGQFIVQEAPDEFFVYQRVDQNETFQVVLNLSEREVCYSCGGSLLIGNYAKPDHAKLQPYEARVYRFNKPS